MKRLAVSLGLVLVAIFGFAGIAYAENWYAYQAKTHYGFSVATESCSNCHVTHTAASAKLLFSGRTQTEFCYLCHVSVDSSPYDVEHGLIKANDLDNVILNPSTAGKFGYRDGGVSSRHDVDTLSTNSVALAANAIPGNDLSNGNNGFPNGFKCGSCHDVHAGDAANDRLLKNRIWDVQAPLANVINFAYDSTTLQVTKYAVTANEVNAINGYCGLCHGRFNVGNDAGKLVTNAAMQNVAGSTYYRHALGVSIAANSSPTLAPYLGNPDPTSGAGKNVVLCLTCHYAHGSSVMPNAESGKTWSRDGDMVPVVGPQNGPDGGPQGNGNPGSTLLRMDKRGVCFDCHGAANKNVESYGELNQ